MTRITGKIMTMAWALNFGAEKFGNENSGAWATAVKSTIPQAIAAI